MGSRGAETENVSFLCLNLGNIVTAFLAGRAPPTSLLLRLIAAPTGAQRLRTPFLLAFGLATAARRRTAFGAPARHGLLHGAAGEVGLQAQLQVLQPLDLVA